MPPIASGINRRVAYKAESTWGVIPSAGSAQILRRVESTLDLRKDTYQSNEVRSDFQIADFRHGVRSIAGSINGELSAGTYKDFMAAAVRQAFAAIAAITGASITVAGSGPTYTLTRAAGSWITDGVKIGQVGRLTAGSFNAANLNKNLAVVAESATVLTVVPLNGVALVAEGPIGSATFAVTGKVAFVPTTGHTDPSFSIEHWHADVSISEVFSGCKLSQMDLQMPPSGMATIGLQMMGKDVTKAASAYYTSPTAETGTGVLASVNGLLILQGAPVALVTGATLNINGNMSATPVAGSNSYPDIFEGRVIVGGQLTFYFQDDTIRAGFDAETEFALALYLTASSAAAADFIGINLPRIKLGGASKNDGEQGIQQTAPFQALKNTAGGVGTATEATTIEFQDSQA